MGWEARVNSGPSTSESKLVTPILQNQTMTVFNKIAKLYSLDISKKYVKGYIPTTKKERKGKTEMRLP